MCCRWNENRETHESTIKGTNGGKATFFGSGGKDFKHQIVDRAAFGGSRPPA
jgi:hypothetical protein